MTYKEENLKHPFLFGVACIASLFATSKMTMAREFPIGGPVQTHDMEISANYLVGVTVLPGTTDMAKGGDVIHLETDVHATADNPWGYPDGAWIAYMPIKYHLRKAQTSWMNDGELHPMTAKDGPHYANNVKMDGPGTYTVTFEYHAPTINGFQHHSDNETGTPGFWETFTQNFTFNYPQQ